RGSGRAEALPRHAARSRCRGPRRGEDRWRTRRRTGHGLAAAHVDPRGKAGADRCAYRRSVEEGKRVAVMGVVPGERAELAREGDPGLRIRKGRSVLRLHFGQRPEWYV